MQGIDYLFRKDYTKEPLKNNQARKIGLKQSIIKELYFQGELSIFKLSQTIKMSTPPSQEQ